MSNQQTILIVDDHQAFVEVVKEYLRRSGTEYNVISANTSKDCIETAIKEIPDLIIMDWVLPDNNGLDTIKILKAKELTRDIPVIMSTGLKLNSDNLSEALHAGAIDFLRKPYDDIELIARVQSVLLLSTTICKVKEQKMEIIKFSKMKDKLLAIIAHDLRGPVGNLNSLLEIVIDELENYKPNELKNTLSALKESSITTYNLLENMLLWARSNTGKLIFHPEFIDICFIIEENIALFSASAKRKNITIKSEINENLEVFADDYMVSTIMRNLISNAIKYTANNGNILVSSKLEEKFIEITITDSGIGMDEKNFEKIFNFRQFYTTKGTNQESGSGLGLKICKEFVEINGGKIIAQSLQGKGTTIRFSLPRFAPHSRYKRRVV